MKLIEGDPRQPVAGWLTYAVGIEDPEPYFPMGPNLLGETLWPVEVERLEDCTRIGFAYSPPPAPKPEFYA